MFFKEQYALVDFGAGRRLERFGELLLDRPCPSAERFKAVNPEIWKRADVRFVENARSNCSKSALGFRGEWIPATELGRKYFAHIDEVSDAAVSSERGPDMRSGLPWMLKYADKFVFELKGSPFGHIGIFPEQAENWDRIDRLCREGSKRLGRKPRVLNLFGYTGGSALAAFAAGAEVAHLDAARNIVAQARRNAAFSFASGSFEVSLPIRWIVDDAVKFVKRELKRGSRYDGIILDPPSYGHGARGEVWRLSRDLPPLLMHCVELLQGNFGFILLTAHTPGYEFASLERLLRTSFREQLGARANVKYLAKSLEIISERGAALPAGDLALAIARD